MVHQMWEKGLITSLDDEFSKYVPEFGINNPFGKKSITLRFIFPYSIRFCLVNDLSLPGK